MAKKEIPPGSNNKIIPLVLVCFFLSGLTGLIYEILWTRMIIKIIGGAPFAVSIILTIFMGGLGIGSYIASRTIDRFERPAKLVQIYGTLELAIGAYAFAIPALLAAFKPVYALLYNHLYGHFMLYNLLTFIGCFILLCTPVICMGATLPILCRFYVTRLSHLGTHAGRLYGLNTIGAALGALLCGFWLINLLSMWGTLILAVSINGIIGFACLLSGRKMEMPQQAQEQAEADSKEALQKTAQQRAELSENQQAINGALVIFAVSGFCAMAYEVIWTKLLGLIVGPTTYSFTIVLVSFILGLAVGSMIFGFLADKIRRPIWLLIYTQSGAALFALLISQVFGNSQLFFAKLIYQFQNSFALLNISKAGLLFGFMFLPTLCLGATFPLVGKIYTQSVSKIGRSIGFAYAINTVGAVSGSFCAGFVLIPLAGKERSLSLVIGLQLLTSLVITGILLSKEKSAILRRISLAAPALAGLLLCLHFPVWNHRLLSEGEYHRFDNIEADIESSGWLEALFNGTEILSDIRNYELVYYGDGIGGFTTVIKHTDRLGNTSYRLLNSGKPDASSQGDMDTQTLLAHFPMLFHPNPKTVMVLGLASGITAGETLYYPIEKLDVLDINRQVVRASDFFLPWNNNVLSDPRTNLIIQDGRAHLLLTKQKYDVIISEPSNPWMAGLAALFTRDFFTLAKNRLNEDGIFVQWLHAYQMDWATFALVGRTFAQVFPNSILVSAMPPPYETDYLLVGLKGKNRLVPDNARQKIFYARQSKNITLCDPKILYRLILSEDLEKLFGQGPVNTDDWPRLEFSAPKLMYQDLYLTIKRNIASKRWLSPETEKINQQITTDVDSQIDYAVYALSVYEPFAGMVDFAKATPSQKDRFLQLMDTYCATNFLNPSFFTDDYLKQRCRSIQIESLQSRIDTVSGNGLSYFYLADLYRENGMLAEAATSYFKSLQFKPDNVMAHYRLAYCLYKQGQIGRAVEHYEAALRLGPNWAQPFHELAWIYATSRDPRYRNGAKAVELAEKACKYAERENPIFFDTLAAAYAETGQFEKAEQIAQKAINLALSANNTDLAKSIDIKRQLYRAGKKPYEDAASVTP